MVEELHVPSSGGARRQEAPGRRPKQAGPLAAAARRLADLVWPPACAACRAPVAEAGGLCAACWAETRLIQPPACRLCGQPLDLGGPDATCDACLHAPPAWSEGAAAAVYEGAARRLALGLKHADRLDIAALGARWMLAAEAGRGARLVAAADLVAPPPLHWLRMLKRRYNQSGELARAICRLAGRPAAFAPDLLRRTRATPTQEGRNRLQRHENVAGAFAVAPRWRGRLAGARVLLVDDVLTTGATLSACAEACRAAGAADVTVLALARVVRESDAP